MLRKKNHMKGLWCICFLVFGVMSVARGEGFGINSTRVIYHQQDKAVQISLRNTSKKDVYLVQSSVVDKFGSVSRRFEVVPPLLRLDAGSEGSVRVLWHSGTSLPADRESLFWFRALAIPSINPLTQEGRKMMGEIRMIVGNRIKFFYRPEGVPDPTERTFSAVTFSRVPGGIQLKNPTPYYISLSSLSVDGKNVSASKEKMTVSPFSSEIFLTPGRMKKTVSWSVINDLGGTDRYTGTIS